MPRYLVSIDRLVAFFSYTPLLFVAAIVSFFRIVLYARYLEIEQFALLSKMLLVSTVFIIVGHLGTRLAAERDVAAFLAGGRRWRAVVALSQSVMVSTSVALLVLISGVLGLRPFGLSSGEFIAGILHGWSWQIFSTLLIESRGRLALMQFARDSAVRSFLIAASGVAAVIASRSGLGVVAVEALVTVLMIPRLASAARSETRLGWRAVVGLAMKARRNVPWRASGFLLSGSALSGVSINLDRWIAAEKLATPDFGAYAFAWLPMLAALQFQFLLNAGVQPLLVHRRVAQGQKEMLRLAAQASLGLLASASVLGLCLGPMALIAVDRWFERYTSASAPLLILAGAAVLRVSDFWGSFLVANRRDRLFMNVQLGTVAFAFLVYATYAFFGGRPITAVELALFALFMALASFVANAVAAFLVKRDDQDTARSQLKEDR